MLLEFQIIFLGVRLENWTIVWEVVIPWHLHVSDQLLLKFFPKITLYTKNIEIMTDKKMKKKYFDTLAKKPKILAREIRFQTLGLHQIFSELESFAQLLQKCYKKEVVISSRRILAQNPMC